LKILSLFYILLVWAGSQAQGIECPPGYHSQVVYNHCRPEKGHVCPLWYSKFVCVPPGDVPMACTADLNPWGHPSHCICPEGQVYSPVTGFCHSKTLDIEYKGPQECDGDQNAPEYPGDCI
jgi:hypothetical protein